MSADNWAICPRCKKQAEAGKEAKQLAAGEAYGQVERDVYLEMLREAETPIKLETSLREDYEISIGDEGEFFISYRGRCDVCGFNHKFEHSEQLKI